MITVSIIWSLTPVLDKLCLEHSSINFHGFIQSLGMIILLVFLFKKNKVQTINTKKNWGLILLTVFRIYCNYFSILCNFNKLCTNNGIYQKVSWTV